MVRASGRALCPPLGASSQEGLNMSAKDGHVVDLAPDQDEYEVCARCGHAIQDDVYGRGLVTMTTGNPECYGRSSAYR